MLLMRGHCHDLKPKQAARCSAYFWDGEIATMWRFTRNNGITEGFHANMEVLQPQAYGFCNFENYRLRVKVLCS
jgi:transposase